MPITGVYLLLSRLPTSHTNVHAVPHTVVPMLDSIRDTNQADMGSPPF